MLGNDHSEIQAAFTGLLANPIVTPWSCLLYTSDAADD